VKQTVISAAMCPSYRDHIPNLNFEFPTPKSSGERQYNLNTETTEQQPMTAVITCQVMW